MKIQQIGKYTGDIVSTILENRNVKNVELFLNPTNENSTDPFKFANLQKGAEILLSHLIVDNEVGILVDPDADGLTSSTILFRYLKKINPEAKISYFLHDTKAHGLTEKIMNQLSESNINLLLIPDAASNDNEAIKKLVFMGLDVVIIDHHEIDKYPEFGVMINNQSSLNLATNQNFTGAGMVLKFCEALDKILGTNHAEEFYDLAAIGQIGDGSDIGENEIRYLVFKGIKSVTNPFLLAALKDSFGDLDKIVPMDLSFSVIPLINAVVRVGTMEEKHLLFRALNSIDADETWTVIKKKKNKTTGKFDKVPITMNLYEYALDTLKSVKARQANMVKKAMALLDSTMDNIGGVAIGILPTSDEGSVTGLIANKFASKLKKPVLIVHELDGKYVGSGRGYDAVLSSLKDFCQHTGLVEFAQGHANAFGISILKDNFLAFKEKLKDVEKEDFIWTVDVIVSGRPDKQLIIDACDHRELYGGSVREPLFAFTNIKVRKSFIRMRGTTLTFYDNGVEFIMFNATQDLYDDLTLNFDEYIALDFVGRPSINTWGGKTTVQLVLEDYDRAKVDSVEITTENIVF